MGKHGEESEVKKLIRERDLMMQEVVQLRQEHLLTVQKMDAVNQRIQSAEMRQKQMISFLAKVLQNPVFLSRLKKLKEQRGIASVRARRKFLKQQHLSSAVPDEPMDQQIVKGFWDASALVPILCETGSGESSGALLPVFEQSEGKQLPDHLLQDVDKLGLETHGQDIFGPSNESKDIKGKKMLSSQMEAEFGGSNCFISLPDDVTPEEIVPVNLCPTGLTASKGKDIVNLEADDIAAGSGVGTEYLEKFAEDISQGRMFPEAIAPASDCVGEEGIWNIGLDAGGSSLSPGAAVWDSLGYYHAQEMESAAGSCSLWGLGLHNLEEDLDIDRYVGDESFLQEHKNGGQQNEDFPKDLEP